MRFQKIWKKAKKLMALMLAITLFFGGWGNYDFKVFAAAEIVFEFAPYPTSASYTGAEIQLPKAIYVRDVNDNDVENYKVPIFCRTEIS